MPKTDKQEILEVLADFKKSVTEFQQSTTKSLESLTSSQKFSLEFQKSSLRFQAETTHNLKFLNQNMESVIEFQSDFAKSFSSVLSKEEAAEYFEGIDQQFDQIDRKFDRADRQLETVGSKLRDLPQQTAENTAEAHQTKRILGALDKDVGELFKLQTKDSEIREKKFAQFEQTSLELETVKKDIKLIKGTLGISS